MHTYIHTYIYTCIDAYMHIYIYIHIHLDMWSCICIYIYTHENIYIHLHKKMIEDYGTRTRWANLICRGVASEDPTSFLLVPSSIRQVQRTLLS